MREFENTRPICDLSSMITASICKIVNLQYGLDTYCREHRPEESAHCYDDEWDNGGNTHAIPTLLRSTGDSSDGALALWNDSMKT